MSDISGLPEPALEELVTNCIKYGYDDSAEHAIEVLLSIAEQLLTFEIIDDGRAFDPSAVPLGPGAADVAAANEMSPEQRNELVRGMVERLALRLKEQGSDVDGWSRLLRAYMVLGEPDKARAAAGDARRALAGEPDKVRMIEELIKGLGLEG